jgi:hypothetical protein
MASKDFVDLLEEQGYQNAGLCIFAPAIMAPIANRLLNEAYGDSGDNLSIPMYRIGSEREVRYLAGNYSSASLIHTKVSIDVLERVPGAVMLVTEAGVGASTARTLGLLENGQTKVFENREHSFYSFAEEYLAAQQTEQDLDAQQAEQENQIFSMENIREKVSKATIFQFQTPEELDVRREILATIEGLGPLIARAVNTPAHGGIGHNQPPPEKALLQSIVTSLTVNINIIKTEVLSGPPDVEAVVEAISMVKAAGEEATDFFCRTLEQVKSIGSKALAAAIIYKVLELIWNTITWVSAVLGLPIL